MNPKKREKGDQRQERAFPLTGTTVHKLIHVVLDKGIVTMTGNVSLGCFVGWIIARTSILGLTGWLTAGNNHHILVDYSHMLTICMEVLPTKRCLVLTMLLKMRK